MAEHDRKIQKQLEELKIKLSKALENGNLNQNEILKISRELDEVINLLMNK